MSDDGLSRYVEKGLVLVSEKDQQAQAIELSLERRRAWQAERELAKANEQRDRLGERLKQLEDLLASHFARSVRMLSGSRRQFGESQDAARAVDALEDHLRALRLLNNNGVECDRVEHGVRLLLDLRDRVVNEPPAQPTIVEVTVQPEVYEVGGHFGPVGEEMNRCNWVSGPLVDARYSGRRCVLPQHHESVHQVEPVQPEAYAVTGTYSLVDGVPALPSKP